MASPSPSLTDAPLEITNSIGMKLRYIQAGKFRMGTRGDQKVEFQHEVEITQPFYLGVYEVTQGQYQQVMDENPSQFKEGPEYPVETVTWFDANEFCRRLSLLEAESRQGRMYLLPTEAQWEYCCRAGTSTTYFFGDDAGEVSKYAWTKENSDSKSHPVGKKAPNAWGLYDMIGNVWEWTWDKYRAEYYKSSPPKDPMGLREGPPRDPNNPGIGGARVLRGGSWDFGVMYCRDAFRLGDFAPTNCNTSIGFRVILRPASGPARP